MKPQTFSNEDPHVIFTLDYPGGEQDTVVGVRVDGESILIEFPYVRAARLKVGRIEREDADSISFTVADPQSDMLDGVVTLTRTTRRWE